MQQHVGISSLAPRRPTPQVASRKYLSYSTLVRVIAMAVLTTYAPTQVLCTEQEVELHQKSRCARFSLCAFVRSVDGSDVCGAGGYVDGGDDSSPAVRSAGTFAVPRLYNGENGGGYPCGGLLQPTGSETVALAALESGLCHLLFESVLS